MAVLTSKSALDFQHFNSFSLKTCIVIDVQKIKVSRVNSSEVDPSLRIDAGEQLTEHYDVIMWKCFVSYSPPCILIQHLPQF